MSQLTTGLDQTITIDNTAVLWWKLTSSRSNMLKSMKLCTSQGIPLFRSVYSLRIFCPFSSIRISNISFTNADYMRLLCNSFTGKLVQLFFGISIPNKKKQYDLMLNIVQRVISKQAVLESIVINIKHLINKKKYSDAVVLLQQAIKLGHLPSYVILASMLLDGIEGVGKDARTAYNLVFEGASLGCYDCKGMLAICYTRGAGCYTDKREALSLATISAKMNSKYGQVALGNLLIKNTFWQYKSVQSDQSDHEKAICLYKLAVAQNYDKALYYLAKALSLRSENLDEAFRLYRLAAMDGNVLAMYRVGRCFMYGCGIYANRRNGIDWYMRAERAGSVKAYWALKELKI